MFVQLFFTSNYWLFPTNKIIIVRCVFKKKSHNWWKKKPEEFGSCDIRVVTLVKKLQNVNVLSPLFPPFFFLFIFNAWGSIYSKIFSHAGVLIRITMLKRFWGQENHGIKKMEHYKVNRSWFCPLMFVSFFKILC